MDISLSSISEAGNELRGALEQVSVALNSAEWNDSVRDSYDDFYTDCLGAVGQIEEIITQLLSIEQDFSTINVDKAIEDANKACQNANYCY